MVKPHHLQQKRSVAAACRHRQRARSQAIAHSGAQPLAPELAHVTAHLSTLEAYLNDFLVGNALTGTASGTMSLPATTTINATHSIVIGSNAPATLTLGRTSNTFLTNQPPPDEICQMP